MSALQSKLDETMAYADDLLRQRLKREAEELERQDAADRVRARVRARENHEAKRLISERYDAAFAAHNVQTPQAADDEPVGAYRRRLFGRLMRRLPDAHELQGIRADDLPSGIAFDNFERMLLAEAAKEGLNPSFDSLPSDNSMVARNRVDEATGERSITWHGRQSFIKDLSRGGRRVLRVINPRDGTVLMGPPFDRAY